MSEHSDDTDVEYDAASGTYRATYAVDGDSPSVRVLEAVAAVRETEPTQLAPLDEYVEPDALDAVFTPTRSTPGTHGSLSFGYEGLLVVVHSDGEIELREQV